MINYTINSTDPKQFNVIKVVLPNMTSWNHATLTVSSLVANCHIVVLEKGDWITFEFEDRSPITITITKDYTNIQNADSFVSIITEHFKEIDINVKVLETQCLKFSSEKFFAISKLSYNMKMLTGLYCETEFPISSQYISNSEFLEDESELEFEYSIKTVAVGFLISTPILYLISNLGDVNLHNSLTEGNKIQSNNVCIRIQNSFTPYMPLITSNADFVKKIHIGDITNFEVRLVDANLHDVKLLTPMWVTFTIQDCPPDEKDAEDFWQFNYLKQPRELKTPSQLLQLNPQLIEDINLEPTSYS
jgi:hypothetical protein